MRRKKKRKTREFLESGLCGIAWIIIGIQGIFENNGVFDLVANIFLVISMFAMTKSIFVKTENGSYDKEVVDFIKLTGVGAYNILLIGSVICAIIIYIKGSLVIDLKFVYPFLLGGLNLSRYIFCVIYNKINDSKCLD